MRTDWQNCDDRGELWADIGNHQKSPGDSFHCQNLEDYSNAYGIQTFPRECKARAINFLGDSSSVGTFFSGLIYCAMRWPTFIRDFYLRSGPPRGRSPPTGAGLLSLSISPLVESTEDRELKWPRQQIFNCKSRLKYTGRGRSENGRLRAIRNFASANEFKYLNCAGGADGKEALRWFTLAYIPVHLSVHPWILLAARVRPLPSPS